MINVIELIFLLGVCSAIGGIAILPGKATGWIRWRSEVVIVIAVGLLLQGWLLVWIAHHMSASV